MLSKSRISVQTVANPDLKSKEKLSAKPINCRFVDDLKAVYKEREFNFAKRKVTEKIH